MFCTDNFNYSEHFVNVVAFLITTKKYVVLSLI